MMVATSNGLGDRIGTQGSADSDQDYPEPRVIAVGKTALDFNNPAMRNGAEQTIRPGFRVPPKNPGKRPTGVVKKRRKK